MILYKYLPEAKLKINVLIVVITKNKFIGLAILIRADVENKIQKASKY